MSFRKQIGSAIWLWELLSTMIPREWDGKSHIAVAYAQPLSDVYLAIRLDAKTSTIAAWRRRLKAAALFDWTVKRGAGRVYIASPIAGRQFFKSANPETIWADGLASTPRENLGDSALDLDKWPSASTRIQ